jgi:hypothetical protein
MRFGVSHESNITIGGYYPPKNNVKNLVLNTHHSKVQGELVGQRCVRFFPILFAEGIQKYFDK